MIIAIAVVAGFIMDILFGDPSWIRHPVVIMGKGISIMENALRRMFPKTDSGEFAAGLVMTIVLPVLVLAVTAGVCVVAYMVHPGLCLAVETLWCWQAFSMKGLKTESMNVYRCLAEGELNDSRKAVGRIVGRDTANLDETGVTKAAVETVAENFGDGVMSPLVFMIIGGAPLAMFYKSINTMDSMVGYKNKRFLFFGRAAAKLDDFVNYIPARLGGIMWVAGAMLSGYDYRNSWRIWRRDRRNHASPNSAQTEAACAGALGIRLAGPAYYFGEYYEKPYIGDAINEISYENIRDADRMMYCAGIVAVILAVTVRAAAVMIISAAGV